MIEIILPATVGAGATLAAVGLRFHIQNKLKEDKLRKALHAEVSESDLEYTQKKISQPKKYPLPKNLIAPDRFYQNNTNDIGILSEDEIESIITYYTKVQAIQSKINSLHSIQSEGSGQPQAEQQVSEIESEISDLIKEKQIALNKIRKNLDNDPGRYPLI